MANDAVGSDFEMRDCNKNALQGKTCEMFRRNNFFMPISPRRGKLIPGASGSRFIHPCRQNIIDVCPSYDDVFSWWVGFVAVTRWG